MASFYTVVQYVPDPVADERVNAGIIVFSQDRVAVRFVKNWARLQRFGNKDVRFLRDFARELEERIEPRLDRPTLSEAAIREMAATWKDAIQFTTPRGSLLSIHELLKDAEVRFLASDRSPESRPYTRHFLRKLAIDATVLAFVQRGGVGAREMVKRDFSHQRRRRESSLLVGDRKWPASGRGRGLFLRRGRQERSREGRARDRVGV